MAGGGSGAGGAAAGGETEIGSGAGGPGAAAAPGNTTTGTEVTRAAGASGTAATGCRGAPDPAGTASDPTPYWSAFDPGLLQPQTTYYWRVEANASLSTPVWSFTTGTVAVRGKSWSAVKQLYADPAPH